MEPRGRNPLPYRMDLKTYMSDTKFTVSQKGIEYQYYEVLKYVKEKVRTQEAVGRCPFFEVDTVMVLKLAAMEYAYAKLNREHEALGVNKVELVKERCK